MLVSCLFSGLCAFFFSVFFLSSCHFSVAPLTQLCYYISVGWGCCLCFSFSFCGGCVVGVLVGFSGSRCLPGSWAGSVSGLVRSVLGAGRGVAVGCAPGLDALVRSCCPDAVVFRARSRSAASLVSRSVGCVRAVAGSGAGRGFVVFPGGPCPPGLRPSSVPSRCFCGAGSGSWASAAFAAGLGVPVVVFGVPAEKLPAAWGRWVSAGSGVWAEGLLLVPVQAPVQMSLF